VLQAVVPTKLYWTDDTGATYCVNAAGMCVVKSVTWGLRRNCCCPGRHHICAAFKLMQL
jgi:hypothetical protein